LHEYTGWRPFAKNYRLAVGITELVSGAVLILIPGKVRFFSTNKFICFSV
jgi:hypothetical protein